MAVRLPKEYQPGFRALLALSADAAARLLDAVEVARPAILPEEIAEEVSPAAEIPPPDATTIIDFLLSFYDALADAQPGKSPTEFIDELCQGAEEAGFKPGPTGWASFKRMLARAAGFHSSLGVSSKALDILHGQQRIFLDSKVFTDIRPVFVPKTDDRPAGALIVHQLELRYRIGDEEKSIFIALDSFDLAKLRDVIDRAENKATSLESVIEKSGLRLLA